VTAVTKRRLVFTVVGRIELAAINGNARVCRQPNRSAKRDGLGAPLADRQPVILAKIVL
jgi:hypothetical protein